MVAKDSSEVSDRQENNLAFTSGQKAAIEWLSSLPEYQAWIDAIKARPNLKRFRPSPPNEKLTKYLFKLAEQIIKEMIRTPSMAPRLLLQIGDKPPALKFVLGVTGMVQFPMYWLAQEVRDERALKALHQLIDPKIARYRRMIEQLKSDPLFNLTPAFRDAQRLFCEGILSVLIAAAPRLKDYQRRRSRWGIHKPLVGAPYRQEIFDTMLVSLVDYLREGIPVYREKKIFKYASKILSLAWPTICPDKPAMWRARYHRAKGSSKV